GICFCFTLICVCTFSANKTYSQASDKVSWVEAKAKLEALPFERTKRGYEEWCQKSWDILWPLAKKGFLEARAELLESYYMHGRTMPGHEDWVSIKRDHIIYIIHSAGYDTEKDGSILLNSPSPDFLKEMLNADYKENEFSECRKDKLTLAC